MLSMRVKDKCVHPPQFIGITDPEVRGNVLYRYFIALNPVVVVVDDDDNDDDDDGGGCGVVVVAMMMFLLLIIKF